MIRSVELTSPLEHQVLYVAPEMVSKEWDSMSFLTVMVPNTNMP